MFVQRDLEPHVLPFEPGDELLALRDVLRRADESAVRHRPARNGECAAVGELHDAGCGLVEFGKPLGRETFEIDVPVGPLGVAIFEELADAGAGLHLVGRQSVQLGVEPVANHEALFFVEHGQSLRHVVDGEVEAKVLRAQLALALLERLRVPVALLGQLVAFAQVANGEHLDVRRGASPKPGAAPRSRTVPPLVFRWVSHRWPEEPLAGAELKSSSETSLPSMSSRSRPQRRRACGLISMMTSDRATTMALLSRATFKASIAASRMAWWSAAGLVRARAGSTERKRSAR